MLETIWFILWGLLWAVYFMLDGFDFGMGTLMPFITKNETERRTLYNAAGPFWDGNEVWLITAGGVTFAAFPKVYAVMFSALYAPLLIILFALIMRAVSYEFRAKVDCGKWRTMWDCFQFLGNFLPALLFGVAFANFFMGIPIDADGVYHGNILKLLSPYGLAGGIFFVVMFCMHGALWLAIKSSGVLHDRALNVARGIWPYLVGLAIAFLALSITYTNLWANYVHVPALYILPILAVVALITSRFFMASNSAVGAWVCSAVFIVCVTFFGVAGMFPSMLISSIDPAATLTAFNASSSTLTLSIMLGVTVVMIPIVICYQAWAYSVFRHKITDSDLNHDNAY
ncbi:MAG: cytochrome d ubiquinol oxidase subunit II [Pseudomonadota bacterium]